MLRKRLLAFATIISLILLNHWLFAVFWDADYLLWYLNNGTLIGAGITFIALASEKFKKDLNAISTDPFRYAMTYVLYLAKQVMILATELRYATGLVEPKEPGKAEENAQPTGDAEASDSPPGCIWGLVDSYLTLLWMFILVVAIFLWVVVVATPQYFVFLICGALPRYLSNSKYRFIERTDSLELKLVKKSEKLDEDWQEASMAIEPVTLTNLLSILFFAVVEHVFIRPAAPVYGTP